MFWFSEAGRGACVCVCARFRRGINIQSSHAFKTVLKTHLYTQYHKRFEILPSYPHPPILCACVCAHVCARMQVWCVRNTIL